MGHVQNMFDKCVCIYTYIYIYIMLEGFRICLLFGGLPMGDHPAFLGSFSSNGQAPAKEVFEMTAECGGACPN